MSFIYHEYYVPFTMYIFNNFFQFYMARVHCTLKKRQGIIFIMYIFHNFFQFYSARVHCTPKNGRESYLLF